MRSQALWLWSITAALLVGCEAKLASKLTVTSHKEFVELKSNTITMKVKVIHAQQPTTLAFMKDSTEDVSYSSLTVHDCKSKTSTLKHLTVYDSSLKVITDVDLDSELDVESGSIGEAEMELACSNGGTHV